jgi:hypothetical protein
LRPLSFSTSCGSAYRAGTSVKQALGGAIDSGILAYKQQYAKSRSTQSIAVEMNLRTQSLTAKQFQFGTLYALPTEFVQLFVHDVAKQG